MRGRRSRIALAIAVVAGLIGLGFEGASVASADGEPAGRPAAYCAVWDALRPYDGLSASGVALPDGTLVDADVVHATGETCQAEGARVALDGGVFRRPAAELHGRSRVGAATRGQGGAAPAVGEGTLVVDNVAIGVFNTELRVGNDPYYGIYLYWFVNGTVLLRLNGVSTYLNFVGDLRDLDNYELNVSTPAGGITVPGFAPDAFSFSGTVKNFYGTVSVDLRADAGRLLFQGLTLSGTHLRLRAGGNQTTRLEVAGTAAIGPSSVGLDLSLELAPDGTVVTGSGSASVDLRGDLPDGSPAQLSGQATVSITGNVATLSLSASGRLGSVELTPSNLSIGLVGQRATISGVFGLQFPGGSASVNGQLVYDGDNARLETLSGTAAASYGGALADGTPIAVSGTAVVGATAAGAVHASFTGSGNVGPWAAAGVNFEITGTPDAAQMNGGLDLTLNGTAVHLAGSATIAGTSVTQLDLSGAISAPLTIGSTTVVGGTLHLARTSSGGVDLTLTGSIQLAGGVSVSGEFAVVVDAAGHLTALTGSGTGQDITVSSALKLVDVRFSLTSTGLRLTATAQLACRNAGGVLVGTISTAVADTANWSASLTGSVPAAGCEVTQGLVLGAGSSFSGTVATVSGATSARLALSSRITDSFLPLGSTNAWDVSANVVLDASGLRADLAATSSAISGSLTGAVGADGTFTLTGSAAVTVVGTRFVATGSVRRAVAGGPVSGNLHAQINAPLSLTNSLTAASLNADLSSTGLRLSGQVQLACVAGGSLSAGFDTVVADAANWSFGVSASTAGCAIARDVQLGATTFSGTLASVAGAASLRIAGTATATGAGLPFGSWQLDLDVKGGTGGYSVGVGARSSDGLAFTGSVSSDGSFSFALTGTRIAIGTTGRATFSGTFSSVRGAPVVFNLNGSLSGTVALTSGTVLTAASFKLTNTGTSGVSGTVKLACPVGTVTASGSLSYTSATDWSVGVNVAAKGCGLQGKVILNNNEVLSGSIKMVNGVSSFVVTARIAAVNLYQNAGYFGSKLDLTNIDVRLASTPQGGLDLSLNSVTMNYRFFVVLLQVNVGVTFSLRVTNGQLVSLGLSNFKFGFGIYSQSWVKSDIDRFTRDGLAL